MIWLKMIQIQPESLTVSADGQLLTSLPGDNPPLLGKALG